MREKTSYIFLGILLILLGLAPFITNNELFVLGIHAMSVITGILMLIGR